MTTKTCSLELAHTLEKVKQEKDRGHFYAVLDVLLLYIGVSSFVALVETDETTDTKHLLDLCRHAEACP